MLNPERLVNDLFEDENLADYNLRSFTNDHLLRLATPGNNPGSIYSGLITATLALYNTFFGKMTDEATKIAISEGLTVTMEDAKTEALDEVSRMEALVSFKFDKTSNTYQEFYPQGMSEYFDATLDQLPTLFVRYKNAANANLLVSNPADVAVVIGKIDAFINARNAQLSGFSLVDNLQTGRREDRKNLTVQLTTNMLTIAVNNIDNPDAFNNYYNPSYLPLTEGSLSVSGVVAMNSTVMAINQGVITASSDLTFFNQGTEELVFSVSDQPGVINPSCKQTVAAGNQFRNTDTLPVFTKYYVNIQNPSLTGNGKWKVLVS